MPIYEYYCGPCRHKLTIYSKTFGSGEVVCPHCQAVLKRLFSTFHTRKTYNDVYEGILSDNQLVKGLVRDDPKALVEWNKRMTQGEKPAPEHEEMIGRLEKDTPVERPNPPPSPEAGE